MDTLYSLKKSIGKTLYAKKVHNQELESIGLSFFSFFIDLLSRLPSVCLLDAYD